MHSFGRQHRPSVSGVGSSQSVSALVEEIAARLAKSSHIEDPAREARDLLAALLDVPRHWPMAQANKLVEPLVWTRARAAADKRARGAPLAYAVSRANFRTLTLDVDERVLIPRLETEMLVDLVLEHTRERPGGVAVDVGTGSGAIAISLAIEGTFDRVIATDISTDALEVARTNAAHYSSNIEFVQGSLLAGLYATDLTPDLRLPTSDVRLQMSEVRHQTSEVSVVVSNPPYIAYDEIRELPHSVRDWEPMIALLSGRDGLAITARLVRQAAEQLAAGGLLALEVDVRRASLVAELVSANTRFAEVNVLLDLAGRERFVLATLQEGEDE